MENGEGNKGLDRAGFQLRAAGISEKAPDPLFSGIHSRGYLPHIKREGASYFVTFRLVDSLPQKALLRFKMEQAEAARLKTDAKHLEEVSREFQRKIERFLDAGAGACHLGRQDVANVVAEALLHGDGRSYVLDEWVVMPNHVHLLLWPMPNFTLSEILRNRKAWMAKHANLILGNTGETFWQRESCDHWSAMKRRKSESDDTSG